MGATGGPHVFPPLSASTMKTRPWALALPSSRMCLVLFLSPAIARRGGEMTLLLVEFADSARLLGKELLCRPREELLGGQGLSPRGTDQSTD